jgi:DNA-binding transcriptional LysR family regulator
MNITIRQIQTFLQVAALGSFTRAAEKMHTMQPALSQQIRDLEAELGVRLFDRTTRRVELTQGGAEFRIIATKVMEDLESAVRNAHDLADRKRGRVVIAAPPLLAAVVVPRAIADFRQEHPGLEVKVVDARTDQIVEQVRTGQVDCGLGTFHPGEEGVTTTAMARDSLMVFSASNHQLAARQKVSWRELDDLPLITLTRDSGIRLLVEVGYQTAGIRLVPAYEVTHITTALAMVEAGLGIAVLPTYAWASAHEPKISATALEPRIIRDISLITRAGRATTPAVSAFMRFLKKYTNVMVPTNTAAAVIRPSDHRRKRPMKAAPLR